MIYNYFKTVVRNLFRQKTFSFINVMGLAVGIACSILILLWVNDELSYDRFHENADCIYRTNFNVQGYEATDSPPPLAMILKSKMPEVKNTARISKFYTCLLDANNRKFEEQKILYADPSFFEIFSFPLVKGNIKTALSSPDGIMITEEMAKKYFGTQNAIGKIIRKDNQENFIVTGVMANIPSNSHLQFDFILPMASLAKTDNNLKNNTWNSFMCFTYVQLYSKAVSSPESFMEINRRVDQACSPGGRFKINFKLQPLTKIHLYSKLHADISGHGDIQYVRIFSIAAVFILLVACINFMNLSTARSARRAKEIGLRKVVGAKRIQLIVQFLSESLIITFFSLLVALVIVWFCLPAFNNLAEKQLHINLYDTYFVLSLIGIGFATALLSGMYPALLLSGFKPVKILKGNLKLGEGNMTFRNGLVISQFAISILLLVGTIVVYDQLNFIRSKNLGFDKENLIYFSMTGEMLEKQKALKSALEANPLTSNYTITDASPGEIYNASPALKWQGKDPTSQPVVNFWYADENFISIFKMQLLKGRGFSSNLKADTSNFIVNEKALELMRMNIATAVGKPIAFNGINGNIIGVVKDFNFKPIQEPIGPLVICANTSYGIVVVRTSSGTISATAKALENINKALNPAYPFSYNFIDKDLANLYMSEKRMGKIANLFAILAVFISCLGLYGLSAFIAEQRIKEVGVRKVLGASVLQVVYLLLTNFTKRVLIAMIIATPVSWIIMNAWLDNFAYHINISWISYLIVFFVILFIAWLTVGYESIKAAVANPVKSLRTE